MNTIVNFKTILGEVEYKRNIDQTLEDEGHKAWVYLLDQEMKMDNSKKILQILLD